MQIKKHDRSHMVELRDGSAWRIWPGDIPKTLEWRPTTEIDVTDTEHANLLARPSRSLERITGSSDKSQRLLACRRCPAFAPGGLKQTHAAFAQFRKRLRRPTKVGSDHEVFAPALLSGVSCSAGDDRATPQSRVSAN